MANRERCPGYEPVKAIHEDNYTGHEAEAEEVINTAHILHFTFHDVPDRGNFPTVLNLIGGIMKSPQGSDALYAHGYVPNEVLSRLQEHSLKVTVTASKVYSYYCGYTPFSHGITFRSAVINGNASLLQYDPGSPPCKEEINDGEITPTVEKPWALYNIVEGIFGGKERWNDTRHPYKDEELKRVPVLRVKIDEGASRLHERLGLLGYEPDWECRGEEDKYWEGSIPIWETYGDPIRGNTNRKDPPEYLKNVINRKDKNEEVAVKEAKRRAPKPQA